MNTSQDRVNILRISKELSGPLSTYTGNPCQSTGTSTPVSTGDLPVLSMLVLNGRPTSSILLVFVYYDFGVAFALLTYDNLYAPYVCVYSFYYTDYINK